MFEQQLTERLRQIEAELIELWSQPATMKFSERFRDLALEKVEIEMTLQQFRDARSPEA